MEENKLKSFRRNLILIALLELVCGMFMIVFSSNSLSMLIKILGIVAAAYGIITFFAWLIKKDKQGGAPVIITSVLGVAAGAMLIFLTDQITGVFTIIAGIFAGVFGIIKLPEMFTLKKAGFKKWWILLIPVVIIVGIGVFIGLNPENTVSLTAILLGAALIVGCAADIISMAGAASAEKGAVAIPENKENE